MGEKCLKAILEPPGWESSQSHWKVRILTKNTNVQDDFPLCLKHRDQVRVGMSITATPDKDDIIKVIEPNAPKISERMEIMEEAHKLGLSTYAMFCPLLPGIADSPNQIKRLVQFAKEIGAEEVFVEPVNSRGGCLQHTVKALQDKGMTKYANKVAKLTGKGAERHWSQYTTKLIKNTVQAMEKVFGSTDKLRFLLYHADLTDTDFQTIKKLDTGFIRWLGGLKILSRKSTDATKSNATVSFERERFSITHALLDAEGKNRDAVSQEIRGQITQKLSGPSDKEVKSAVNEYLKKLDEAAAKAKEKKAAKSSKKPTKSAKPAPLKLAADQSEPETPPARKPRDKCSVKYEVVSGEPMGNICIQYQDLSIDLRVDNELPDKAIIDAVSLELASKWYMPPGDDKTRILLHLETELKKQPLIKRTYKSLPQTARKAADKMLRNPNMLDEIAKDMETIGIVGERNLARIVYLVGTSRLFEQPMACVIQGDSSTGKSYVISKVASLFPGAVKVEAHNFSAQGLTYMPAGSLEHRFVVAGERRRNASDRNTDETRALREMLSDGMIRRVVKGKMVEQKGPIAYAESTSATKIFAEDANRRLLLESDGTDQQTRKVIDRIGTTFQYGLDQEQIENTKLKHHAAQLKLESIEVRVPFGEALASRISDSQKQNRRSASQILTLIKAIAFLHQFEHPPVTIAGQEVIEATQKDYEAARELIMGTKIGQSIGLNQGVCDTHASIKVWIGQGVFSIPDAAKHIRVQGQTRDETTIRDHVQKLEEHGLVSKVADGKGPKPAKYQLTQKSVEDATGLSLPMAEELFTNLPGKPAATTSKKASIQLVKEEPAHGQANSPKAADEQPVAPESKAG